MATRLDYLERFLDAVDLVSAGRKGSVSEDRWLLNNYDPSFFSAVERHLSNSDDRVRYEVVVLLTKLRERAAMDAVREMRTKDGGRVRDACLGYIASMDEDDGLVPRLMETLEYRRGDEFRNAAAVIGRIGRASDVPALRRIYGQVDGEMRLQMRAALEHLVGRFPELEGKRDLILSVPVFPDEGRFASFLDSGTEYLDVRYRGGILPRRTVALDTYNNVVRGLRRIRIRLYNESDNLIHYRPELTDGYNRLADLLEWASADLMSKETVQDVPDTTCGGSPL